MKKFLMATILLGLTHSVYAESIPKKSSDAVGVKKIRKYLCVTNSKAAGIEYNVKQKAWIPAIFSAGDKYVVSTEIQLKNNKKVTTVALYGDRTPYWFCGAKVASGALLCSGKSSIFVFNEKTLRFIDSFFDGYVDGVDGGLNKPYIVAGNCSMM